MVKHTYAKANKIGDQGDHQSKQRLVSDASNGITKRSSSKVLAAACHSIGGLSPLDVTKQHSTHKNTDDHEQTTLK